MTEGGLETTAGGGVRTFAAWEPLEEPMFESVLDDIRLTAMRHGHSPAELREFAGGADSMLVGVADQLEVALKVAGDDEWLCQVCGGTSRTCECEA